jgi:hypothetical protein
VPAVDPLHWDKPKAAGVGLGRDFSRTLVKARPGARIGLIPAAVGGTSLEQWRFGGDLYNQALDRLRSARKCGRLAAILWHQGESDANRAEASATYAARWVALMQHLRADAGAPDVPIVVGELGEFISRPFAHVVAEQIHALPQLLDHVAVVSAKGLTDKGDKTHFDSASQRELGRRYGAAFFTITPSWERGSTR